MKNSLYLLILSLLVFCCKNENSKQDKNLNPTGAATVYYNGDIIDMVGESPNYKDALVERNGEIIFVGANEKAMEIAGNGHKMIDLKGKTLLPGFIDGHAHFANFGVQAIGAQILPPPDAGANNIPALIEILKEWNTEENRALTGWIFGSGFDDSVLEEKRFPTKEDLDKVSTEYPIMIYLCSFCITKFKRTRNVRNNFRNKRS